ncbi:MAG: hypothetical protein F6K09_25730 [Merismopedia sp. SIO2A8]|nr:hypothetical protein [Merismopedia sp. SIO2A8]
MASLTHEFYQFTYHEQQLRREQEAFEQYRRWYHQSAAEVQQDQVRMQHDINILGWFCRTYTASLR